MSLVQRPDADGVEPPDRCIWGLPGTGKTTELMRVLSDEIASGVPPTAITGVTFRRSMASEFKERAEETVGEELDESHWYRTIHSACFRLLELDREDVVQDNHKAEVCDSLYLDYGSTASIDEVIDAGGDVFVEEDNLGDELFNMYSTCRNLLLDPMEEWHRFDYSRTVGKDDVERFINTYEDYKTDKGLFDFEDMLESVARRGLYPPRRVLIVDEFQDLSPLQIEVYNEWASNSANVYVAGDIYQSIYSFLGADPSFMESAMDSADETDVLDTSYRFGDELWQTASGILERAGYEDIPDIEASSTSSVQRLDSNGYLDAVRHHKDDECLHLVRANFLAERVVDTLSKAGIPFDSMTGQGYRWSGKMRDLYNGVVELVNASESMHEAFGYTEIEFQTLDEAAATVEAVPASDLEIQKKEAKERLEEADHLGEIEPSKWIDSQVLAEYRQLESPFSRLIDSATRTSGQRLPNAWDSLNGNRIGAINHRVSTIHGSKGSEASSVFLLDGTTRGAQTADDQDEEARVWFVGATRAADNLYVVSTGETFTYDIPVGVS